MTSLSPAQLLLLRNWLSANAGNLNEHQAADALNAIASPDFWVWKTSVTRSEVYHGTSVAGTTWNWATYKSQQVPEQNAWTQMFMGDEGPIGLAQFRAGIAAILTGSAPQVALRDHCFAIGRRKATVAEKLLSVAVVNPPANTGNSAGDPGAATNPNNLGYVSAITPDDVIEALR